jgi:RNA polymerase sigma factor (sigma-70 family)
MSTLPPAVLDADVERDPREPAVLQLLVDNHARFLGFLERRLGSRDLAEDILQDAFVRGLERAGSLRKAESAIAWFYRVLRNSITDHFRRQESQHRALSRVSIEYSQEASGHDPELEAAVCACVMGLLDTLKPEYAHALRRVELDGVSVRAYAEEVSITAGNAAVRLHRAREALRRQLARCCRTCVEHGCYECEAPCHGGRPA